MGREFRDDCGFIINVIAKKFTNWGPNNQDPLGFYDNSSESKIKNQNIKRGQLTDRPRTIEATQEMAILS